METTLTEEEVTVLSMLATKTGKLFEQVVAEYLSVRGRMAQGEEPSA